MTRKEHLVELSFEFNKKLVLKDRSDTEWPIIAYCNLSKVEIHGFKEENQIGYFFGLHEFGHVSYGHEKIPMHNLSDQEVIDTEIDAWDWAFKNSKEKFLPETKIHIVDAVDSYLSDFRWSHNDKTKWIISFLGMKDYKA